MEQTQIGIVSPTPMNDWNDKTAYYLLNIVRHNGAVYIARSASEGIEPGVTTGWDMYWLMLVKDGVSPQIQIDAVPTKDSPNLVSSGGTFDALDGKLDKITTTDGYNRAYGVSYEGKSMSFKVASSAVASALVQRNSKGNIKAGTPVEDTDAVPKSYVDALKQSTNPNTSATAGHIGQLCLVGSSDFSPYEVYICVYSDTANNQYVWHKMCTTEAPT